MLRSFSSTANSPSRQCVQCKLSMTFAHAHVTQPQSQSLISSQSLSTLLRTMQKDVCQYRGELRLTPLLSNHQNFTAMQITGKLIRVEKLIASRGYRILGFCGYRGVYEADGKQFSIVFHQCYPPKEIDATKIIYHLSNLYRLANKDWA